MAEDVRKAGSTSGIKEFEAKFKKPHCVVLDSAYSSMGRMIGFKACERSGYTYYDAVILLELLPEGDVTIDEVTAFEKQLRDREWTKEELLSDPEYRRISAAFDRAADIALSRGPCLIHDRIAKNEVLAKGYSCVSVMTYAEDMPAKIVRARISPLYKDIQDDDTIILKIREEDMIRINWHKAHSDIPWGDREEYDLMLSTDQLGRDHTAEVLAMIMKDA